MKKLLLSGALLQIVALFSLVAYSYYPLVVGRELTIEIAPYDPRDLFLGNYAALSPTINRVPAALLLGERNVIKKGDTIFVTLQEDNGIWKAVGASFTKPSQGVFIRGKSPYHASLMPEQGEIFLVYGIERFYASPARAIQIEQQLRSRSIGPDGSRTLTRATIMVAPSGQASLKDVLLADEK